MKLRPVLFALMTAAMPFPAALAQNSAGSASPYLQSRTRAYTSFDNPYAPGGAYDPYRSVRAHSSRSSGPSELQNPGTIDMDADLQPCSKDQSTVKSHLTKPIAANRSITADGYNAGYGDTAQSLSRLNRLPAEDGYRTANRCYGSGGIDGRSGPTDRSLSAKWQK